MNPIPGLLPLMILVILVLLGIPACFSQDYQQLYDSCKQPLKCGGLQELTYPFWGENRREECGYPGFELTCDDDDVLRVNISSVSYRVLDIDNSTRILKVARDDLWNDQCPTQVFNTSLNPDLFNFYPTYDDQSIALYYGCRFNNQPPITPFGNQFSCTVNGSATWSFFQYPITDISRVAPGIVCLGNITLRVNQTAATNLQSPPTTANDLFQSALRSGFWIQWAVNRQEDCNKCVGSGGLCGRNLESGTFACYCSDRRYDSTCNAGNGKSNSGLIIGVSIGGAVLAVVTLGCLIFYRRQGRKHRKQPLAVQAVAKDITTPSSTPPSTANSSNFTKSIPSYPSSNSDLGKGSYYFGVPVFSYAELEQATDNFNPSRELGDGGFGTVYYGELSDGRTVAVKRLYENNYKRVEQFMNEVEILTRLRHPNLVMLFGCTSRSQGSLLVYEYIPNGTVADHLHGKRAKSGLLSWQVRLNIAIETAEALAYLHKSEIIHRDVKTNNILLDNAFHVKVADFGLSRLFPTDVTHVSTAPQGTPGYVDPEYYQCYHLTEKSDVYSFGVVLIELITSLLAVDTSRHRHDINLANMAVNKIQNRSLEEMVDSSLGFETNSTVRRMITLVAELAFQCLQQERDMRPSMEKVLETLKGVQNDDMNAHKVEVVDILVDGGDTGPLIGSADPSPPYV